MILAVASPALAGGGETGDSSGNQPVPTPESTAETGWNPTYSCNVPQGYSSIWDLLRCLGGTIAPSFHCTPNPDGTSSLLIPAPCDPPLDPEDYEVTFSTPQNNPLGPPAYGIKIVRKVAENGSTEPYRFRLKENDPHIQWTRVHVDRPDLVGRIALLDENFTSTGYIQVTINQLTPVQVTTTGLAASKVDSLLITALVRQHYDIQVESAYIVVLHDPTGATVRSVSYRTTDPQIVSSELRIEPLNPPPGQTGPPPPPDL